MELDIEVVHHQLHFRLCVSEKKVGGLKRALILKLSWVLIIIIIKLMFLVLYKIVV